MTLWETPTHWKRQEQARQIVEAEMGVSIDNIPRGKRGQHTADWLLKRRGKPAAIAEYKFRTYIPPSKDWPWQVDVAKVDATLAHAERLRVPALFIVETYQLQNGNIREWFKCGVPCTFNVIVGTRLKNTYRRSTMTLNRPREAADRDDPVYCIPDSEMNSLHILAGKLWE